jgi:Ulp1 family protease
MENDPILITYKSCSIKKSDIDCLSDYQYLNDLIISFYYEILNEKYTSNDIILLDPAVSMSIIFDQDLDDINNCIFQPLEMKNKKFIFVPINDNTKIEYKINGSHWALNIIDVNNNTIYYLDSMLNNISNAKISVRKFQKLFGKKFNFVYALENTYQTNSSDCGMFVLGFTETILKYLKEKNFNSNSLNNIKFDDILKNSDRVKQNNMQSFRQEIKNIIYKLIKNKK